MSCGIKDEQGNDICLHIHKPKKEERKEKEKPLEVKA